MQITTAVTTGMFSRTASCTWLAAVGLACVLSAPAFAASTFPDIQAAVATGRWADAAQHARALDIASGSGDFLSTYVRAAQLMQQGQCEESAALSRALLTELPSFTPAQELIFLCSAQSGNQVAAQAELAALLAIMPEGPQRTIVEQMMLSSQSQNGPHVSAYVEAKPSSNISRQTAATNIGPWAIDPASRGQGGAELTAGVAVSQQLYASPAFDVTGVLKADLSWESVRQLVRPQLSAELPTRIGAIDNVVLSVTPFVTVGFEGGEHTLTRIGVRGAATAQLTDTWVAGWSGRAYRADYPLAAWRKSWEVDNNVSLSLLVNQQTRLTGTVGLNQYLNDDATRNYHALSASLRLDHMMGMGLIVGLQGKVGVRNYAGAPAPTTGPYQQDTFASGRLELSHRDLVIGPVFGSNIRPVVFYEYNTQSSNNVFYDFDSHDIGLTMRAAF